MFVTLVSSKSEIDCMRSRNEPRKSRLPLPYFAIHHFLAPRFLIRLLVFAAQGKREEMSLLQQLQQENAQLKEENLRYVV